ncbi:MAG: hypothetical protein ACREJG_03580 [Candidatus Rokuibacteriota bacterium]
MSDERDDRPKADTGEEPGPPRDEPGQPEPGPSPDASQDLDKKTDWEDDRHD